MIRTDAFEQVEVASVEALWAWLEAHHAQDTSVWLVTWKKHAGSRYVSRDEVLDALLAYGWIDGIRRVLDGDRTMQLISPRRQRAWAESYKRRAARLEAEGRMRPPGRAAVAAAREAGLWDAMAEVDALLVPDDLAAALARAGGTGWFAAAAPSYRRNVLRWIAGARTPATRAARVDRAAGASARGERLAQM